MTHKILAAITELSVDYARNQVRHGISAFQIFDTHAGLIPSDLYHEVMMPYVRQITKAVREEGCPVIFLPKGLGYGIHQIQPEDADILSIDWQTPIEEARALLHRDIGIQGNLDPRLLFADQDTIVKTLDRYVDFGSREQNWIFNLGHGFVPGIPFENAKLVVDWIKHTDWERS
jgi:uroporphyrinogen decarboxylase